MRLEHSPGPGAFQTVPSPRTYEYDRVRYLISSQYGRHPELMRVARRLIQNDPNDYEVEYALLASLRPGHSTQEKLTALE